jgi:release factor glutamine methyltransferase
MMTLATSIQHYSNWLQSEIERDEARAMTTLLLEHVLQVERDQFHKLQQTILSADQLDRLAGLAQRILAGEPLQYAVGEAWFCGLKLMVNKEVLIPRPETEELVEWIISNCRFPVTQLQILDMGTGSGCIALALKRRIRKASVTAADIDENALKVARHNATVLGIDITCVQTDLLHPSTWSNLPLCDLIVSNPPYISIDEKAAMSARVLDHEPHRALFAPGTDSLIFYRQLVLLAQSHLKPTGQLFVELNAAYAMDIVSIMEAGSLKTEIKEDMQGKQRMLRAWR